MKAEACETVERERCHHDWFVHVGGTVRTCAICNAKSYSTIKGGYLINWSEPTWP